MAKGAGSENFLSHIDLSKPRYDQSTYYGRARHFFEVADPRNVLASPSKLEAARDLVIAHRNGTLPKGTTENQLWHAKKLYDSAYHPKTGEKMLLIGRMSFQVPGNMTITGCMLTFFRNPAQIIFWQWVNQSFNAAVNYTNRSGDSQSVKRANSCLLTELMVPYLSATTGAVGTALALNKVAKSLPSLIGRCVPFVAVAAANCINIPLMRQKELKEGIKVTDKDGTVDIGQSKVCAKRAIAMVVFSRIGMAMPAMLFPPVVMDRLVKRSHFIRARPGMQAVLQVAMVGVCLTFTTPLCCALFPQQSSLKVDKLEPELQEKIRKTLPGLDRVYFNKGL